MLQIFTASNYKKICDKLAAADSDLAHVIHTYGYPPMWTRPNTFESLVHIILEQQVSLASALSALHKMREKVKEIVPANVLLLTDEEFKACYFSRQKTGYVKHLAYALQHRHINLTALELLPDNEVRSKLITLKGIGNWTIDVYLMFVLQRVDIFPIGDLAAVNALKRLKKLPKDTTRETLLEMVAQWQPYCTVATMILWHFYLSERREKVEKTESTKQTRGKQSID